jgi:hypothetical protein
MSDEQRVRTEAGWIGVEISRSRVRTPGRAGYGLYRVRGSTVIKRALPVHGPDMKSRQLTEWTGYLFTLEEIAAGVSRSIRLGVPAAPCVMVLLPNGGELPEDLVTVPTRWTSAYRGPRDLGAGDRRAPVLAAPLTVRQRQRQANEAFAAKRAPRRAAGLRARHRQKLSRTVRQRATGNDGDAPSA